MFITDKFVFLHIPKTAGTFVHKVLRELHCPYAWQRKVHSLQRVTGFSVPFFQYQYREVVKHTTRHRIVEACDGSRSVLLAVRNPLDHYVSHYRFNWWRRFPHRWFRDVDLVQSAFGPLSEFEFAQFVDATIQYSRWSERHVTGRRPLSRMSAEWLRFFCTHPSRAVDLTSDEELLAEVQSQMRDIRVLHQESLNNDLCEFLLSMGYEADYCQGLRAAPRVHPGRQTRPDGDTWQSYYSPELAQKVIEAEWLLFSLFPGYRATAAMVSGRSQAVENQSLPSHVRDTDLSETA